MPAVEMLARDYKFFVSLVADTPTWMEILGVNVWKWAEEVKEVDITDFDDGGWGADLPAMGRAKLTLEGNYLRDPETGARDPGQLAVDVASRKRGWAGLIMVKVETRDATPAVIEPPTPAVPFGTIIVTAFPKLSEKGGGNEDKMPWGAEFMVKGAPAFTGEFAEAA